jgi:hypothetical protein
MNRRLLAVLILVCACSPAEARSTLAEHWLRVQQALATEDRENVDDRILEFQQAADDLAVRRLTPYASALVLWAKDRPGVLAEAVVQRARVLDPELPSSYFLLARWQWARREWATAARTYLAGLWSVILHEPSRRALISSSGAWLILVLAWTLAVAILIQVFRYRRQMAHDAVEVSALVFRRPNAIVLAVVLLGLPVFVGLGPVWLVVYLFVLSWAYMSVGQRVTAMVSCAIFALVVPALAMWQQVAGRSPSLMDRVEIMLGERHIDPSTLREFSGYEAELDGIAIYHLVLGELVRMHGDSDGARLQYQKASLSDDADPMPLIFLGNLSMEEGDIARPLIRVGDSRRVTRRVRRRVSWPETGGNRLAFAAGMTASGIPCSGRRNSDDWSWSRRPTSPSPATSRGWDRISHSCFWNPRHGYSGFSHCWECSCSY